MGWLDRLVEARFRNWQQVQLPEFSGKQEAVTVSFDGLSCLVDPDSDPGDRRLKKYPYWAYSEGEFYEALFQWFFGGDVIKWPPHAVEQGWLRTKYTCSACGATLNNSEKSLQWLRGRVEVAKLPLFEIGVQVPMVTCPSCGLAQVFGDPVTDEAHLNQLIKESMLEAFNTAGLVP